MPEPTRYLPGDPELLEQALADAIRERILLVPTISKVHTRERYSMSPGTTGDPESPVEPEADTDLGLTTDPDPQVGLALRRTHVAEIGVPTVSEDESSGNDEEQTQ